MAKWFNALRRLMGLGAAGLGPPVDSPGTVGFTLHDPGTPVLTKTITLPTPPDAPKFSVVGYDGGGHPAGSPGHQAANVFTAVATTLTALQASTDTPLRRWATGDELVVRPRAGRRLAAYYDRRSLSYFYVKGGAGGPDTYTADSHDIVTHELGHAVLDAHCPFLWDMATVEAWAYHEAVADTISFLAVMQYDEVLEHVLATGGDLRTDNLISRVGGHAGAAKWTLHSPYKYIDPVALLDAGPEAGLTGSPHSFSRVMSGACYDIMVGVYEFERAGGVAPLDALHVARNVTGRYLVRSWADLQPRTKVFAAAARAMLGVDATFGSPYRRIVHAAFVARQVIPAVRMLADGPAKPLRAIHLRTALPIRAVATNPLYDVEMRVPDDGIEGVLAGHDLARLLHESDLVGNDDRTPFRVSGGKLLRRHFACGCGTAEGGFGFLARNKYQPEFYRPYKPQNNAGCCGACRQKPPAPSPAPAKIGCHVRYRLTR